MAGVNPTTTEAVFSLEHPLPTYPAGKFKKDPTSISETARSRKVPKTLKIVPVTKYLEIAERFKDAVLNQVDQGLIVPGGISLERYSEQDNVCAYNLHVIHPVMECLNNITSSDTYEVRHTWEHQLCLPNIPKPRHTADDGDESEIDEDAHRPTNKRKRRRTSTTRDSKDYHTEDDDTEHERDHVVVRPDMIGVVKPKGSKINFGHGSEDATSICVLYVEMKTTGTLDCRIPNFEKAAIAETHPPRSRYRMRRNRHESNWELPLDTGSKNLSQQMITYASAHQVRHGALSEYGTSFLFHFPDMPLGLTVEELWDHGVGDRMEICIVDQSQSELVRAALLGMDIEGIRDLERFRGSKYRMFTE